PGVAGYLKVGSSAGLGLPNVGSLFSIKGSVSVMFNTTRQEQNFKIPDAFLPLLHPGDPTTITIFAAAPGLDGQKNPNAPPGGEIYVVATVFADITIGGVFSLTGFIQITVAAGSGGVRLQIIGAVGAQVPLLRNLTGTLNLQVTLGPSPGVVGRNFLALSNSSIPGVQLSGDFLLELNTFANDQTIQTFKIKQRQLASGRMAFDGFERDAAGNLIVTTQTISTHAGFKLVMGGELTVLNTFHILAEVQFRLELAGANAGIELIVNGTVQLGPLGTVDLVDSGFRITRQGLVARFELNLKTDFGQAIGLEFHVNALMSLNTTG